LKNYKFFLSDSFFYLIFKVSFLACYCYWEGVHLNGFLKIQESFVSFNSDFDFVYLNGFSYIKIFKGLVKEYFQSSSLVSLQQTQNGEL